MRIIALTGGKGQGKDATAKIIQKYVPESKRYSLAFPMKEISKYLFGWDKQHTEGELKEITDPEWGISPRCFLQLFGTDVFRELIPNAVPLFGKTNGADFWCKVLDKEITGEQNYLPIITDMRFPNEELYFRRKYDDMVLIKIERPATMLPDSHKSEQQFNLMKPDYVIANTGTLIDLEWKVCKVLSNIGVL
jgi:hypothetical protein